MGVGRGTPSPLATVTRTPAAPTAAFVDRSLLKAADRTAAIRPCGAGYPRVIRLRSQAAMEMHRERGIASLSVDRGVRLRIDAGNVSAGAEIGGSATTT